MKREYRHTLSSRRRIRVGRRTTAQARGDSEPMPATSSSTTHACPTDAATSTTSPSFPAASTSSTSKAVIGKTEVRPWFKPPQRCIAGRDRTKYLDGLDRQPRQFVMRSRVPVSDRCRRKARCFTHGTFRSRPPVPAHRRGAWPSCALPRGTHQATHRARILRQREHDRTLGGARRRSATSEGGRPWVSDLGSPLSSPGPIPATRELDRAS